MRYTEDRSGREMKRDQRNALGLGWEKKSAGETKHKIPLCINLFETIDWNNRLGTH